MWSAYRRSLHLPAMIALKIFRKLLFFACFRFLIFHHFSRGGAADPICPYVRTLMKSNLIDTALHDVAPALYEIIILSIRVSVPAVNR